MSIARYAAFPLGAAVGGTLVATIGSGYALLLDAATYALSASFLVRMRLPARAATAVAPNFLRELVDGWRAFTEHTWVWLLTGWISLYFLVTYAPFFVLGPYIAKQHLGGAAAWTIVVTGEAIGSLAGGLAGLRLRPARSWAVIGPLFVVTSLQCVLLALRAPAPAIGAAAVLAGFAFSFGTVVWETTLQERIPREKLSRVGAYNWFGAMAFLPAGYAIAGPVARARRRLSATGLRSASRTCRPTNSRRARCGKGTSRTSSASRRTRTVLRSSWNGPDGPLTCEGAVPSLHP